MVRYYVRRLLDLNGITFTELARRTSQSPQNLNNKVRNNSMRAREFFKIVEALGGEVHITDKAGNIIV